MQTLFMMLMMTFRCRGRLQLRVDFYSTTVRQAFDCLSKVTKVTVT